jgi:hypothetical protein
MVRINNVRIKDLLGLLYNLSKNYIAVDIIVDPENRKITLDPVKEEIPGPNSNVKLTDQNIEDLI